MNFKRLNHITINAPKGAHDKVRKFYGEVFKLKEIPFPEELVGIYDIIWYQFMDIVLHVEFSETYLEEQKHFDISRHIAVDVENIEAGRKELEECGINIIEGTPLPDRQRFYIQDPFGNTFEIIEMLPAHVTTI